jgi:hypothetical protein
MEEPLTAAAKVKDQICQMRAHNNGFLRNCARVSSKTTHALAYAAVTDLPYGLPIGSSEYSDIAWAK